jgi:hypothetical protein
MKIRTFGILQHAPSLLHDPLAAGAGLQPVSSSNRKNSTGGAGCSAASLRQRRYPRTEETL